MKKSVCTYPKCAEEAFVKGAIKMCRNHALGLPSDVRASIMNGTPDARKKLNEVVIARGHGCPHGVIENNCVVCSRRKHV